MLDAMVNTLNLSRYLANQVMHYRSRSLDNVSIKIAHFPVSSDLKPSEEAPIMDMLIKAINNGKHDQAWLKQQSSKQTRMLQRTHNTNTVWGNSKHLYTYTDA